MRPLFASILPSTVQPMANAFAIEIDADDADTLNLLVSPPGSRMAPRVIWTQRFDTIDDRNAVLEASYKTGFDVLFLGRLTMIFGTETIGRIADRIVLEARDARRLAAENADEAARKHLLVDLYAPDTKHRHLLELRRGSRSTADWKVSYDRSSERDRLCDWLRWQQPRFLQFLDYAAEHGDEALTRRLTDDMFETERRGLPSSGVARGRASMVPRQAGGAHR